MTGIENHNLKLLTPHATKLARKRDKSKKPLHESTVSSTFRATCLATISPVRRYARRENVVLCGIA